MKIKFLIILILLSLFTAVTYYFYSLKKDKLHIVLTPHAIQISLELVSTKLPIEDDVEIHTSLFDLEDNEILFLRSRILEKTRTKFNWHETDLNLEPGHYKTLTQIISFPKLYPEKILFEKTSKLKIKEK
ncbi:MAG: hypothetical protein HYW47_01050 [Deltaproteobacteria bacterium]|nr:hypothetical protein [Deltaproteobacteria bacterium]